MKYPTFCTTEGLRTAARIAPEICATKDGNKVVISNGKSIVSDVFRVPNINMHTIVCTHTMEVIPISKNSNTLVKALGAARLPNPNDVPKSVNVIVKEDSKYTVPTISDITKNAR